MTIHLSEHVVADTLRVPLYASKWYIPNYREVHTDTWRITRCPFHLEHGYTSDLWGISALPLLLRRIDDDVAGWETWMSLTPHEIESQEMGCIYGSGHTVVMGLGMGWVAINMALNPNIRQVTVIEHDPEVISLLELSGALDELAQDIRKKIRIIQADALEWIPDEHVDFLYADIWRGLDEPHTVGQVRQMQAHVEADTVYFWGQEVKLFRMLGEQLDHFRNVPPQRFQIAVMETIGMPLLVPDTGDYVETIEAVMAKRKARGLSGQTLVASTA